MKKIKSEQSPKVTDLIAAGKAFGDTRRLSQEIIPTLKVSNYQQFIAHFQRAVGILNQTAGVIKRRSILPAAINLVAFSDKNESFKYQLNTEF